jgi:hypothetical protein
MQALIGKSLDLLLSGGTPFVYAVLKGADLKIGGGLVNKMPYAFVANELRKGMQVVLDAAAEDDPKARSLDLQQLIDLSLLP